MERISELEANLKSFDPSDRSRALQALLSLREQDAVALDPETDVVNMHCHSFFSFNAYGHSPTSLAWLARRQGFKGVGIVDFDVLDGVDEFLDACGALEVRGSAGIETRVFVPEYATQEINSPGEPGVCYHMGIGFTASQVPEHAAGILADLRQRAGQRNRAIVTRVNAYLDPVSVDYEQDVIPLTPAGNPTERHMVVAYIDAVRRAARHTVADPVVFWADKLGIPPGEMPTIMANGSQFQSLIRARLMKRGGPGYVKPNAFASLSTGSGMFPSLDDFHELILACGALPCAAWLDGTTSTEQAIEEWLRFLIGKGVVALNIIPDRNWNIADPEMRRLKVANLHRVVEMAQELDLPLNVGTEMNSFGQKVVDGFGAPELAPVRQAFLDGALFVYGHTTMQRALGMGYQSDWARTNLPSRSERNEFFTRVGGLVPPGQRGARQLEKLRRTATPASILAGLVV
jgi:hypothetical protein